MSRVTVNEQYLQDTADAIREKTGSSDTYKPSQFASAISDISSGEQIITLTVYNNFGYIQGVKIPPNAIWTGFDLDIETGQVKGTLTIPANSIFIFETVNNISPSSSVVTIEYLNPNGSRNTSYFYVCYVGTSDGDIYYNT